MKFKGEWERVPGWWIDDPASPDGKRFIATHHGWELIQKRVKELANNRCELNLASDCAGHTLYLDTHHRRGRGSGGSKRDDRIWILGIRNLKSACRPCHSLAKIETKTEVFEAIA
jgi:hypothetical protein